MIYPNIGVAIENSNVISPYPFFKMGRTFSLLVQFMENVIKGLMDTYQTFDSFDM